VILDTRYVPARGEGGEAGVATESFEKLATLAPGIQTVVYNKVLRGVHIDRLYEAGILPVVKVAAASRKARRGAKGGQRVDKEGLIEVKEVPLPDGRTEQVPIYARDGAAGLGRLNDEGGLTFIPIERVTCSVDSMSDGCWSGSDFSATFPASSRGRSSAGRAPALQAGGRRFESARLHHRKSVVLRFSADRRSGMWLPGITRPQHASYAGDTMRGT
jgi:hypothetical protein